MYVKAPHIKLTSVFLPTKRTGIEQLLYFEKKNLEQI